MSTGLPLIPLPVSCAHSGCIQLPKTSTKTPPQEKPIQDLLESLGHVLHAELDLLVPVLVKRATVVSVTQKDNFLAQVRRRFPPSSTSGGHVMLLFCVAFIPFPSVPFHLHDDVTLPYP
jgi:hypothetical protein